MGRFIESQFDFVRRYEVEQLERIDRRGDVRVLGFPGAIEVDSQLENTDRPIIRVDPADGELWIGVFYGSQSYGVPPAAPGRLIAWPDERSFCVVYAGNGTVVHTYKPEESYEIEPFPITDLLVVPSHGVVVFADFIHVTAYGAEGLRWETERLVWDDLAIVGVEGERLIARGFNAPSDRNDEFTVELATGKPHGHPYESWSRT